MRQRAIVLSLCGVLAAGVVAAPAASASPVDCVDQLVADLLSAPVPEPTSIVIVEGLNVRVDRTGVDAFSNHVRDAAVRFASCATPDPDEILPCVLALADDIVQSVVWQSDDELYLRYAHVYPEGFALYGENAVADALTLAGCLT